MKSSQQINMQIDMHEEFGANRCYSVEGRMTCGEPTHASCCEPVLVVCRSPILLAQSFQAC
jgi:hypothetical protein